MEKAGIGRCRLRVLIYTFQWMDRRALCIYYTYQVCAVKLMKSVPVNLQSGTFSCPEMRLRPGLCPGPESAREAYSAAPPKIPLSVSNRLAFFCQKFLACLLYTSPSPRDRTRSRMPSSA